MPPPVQARDADPRVFAAQVEALRRQWPAVAAINLVVTLVTSVVLWGHFPAATITAWAACAGVIAVARVTANALVFRFARGDRRDRLQARVYLCAVLAAGVLWGAGALLFLDPGLFLVYSFYVFAVAGMAGGSLPSLSAWPPAYFAFAVPAIGLTAVALAGTRGGFDPLTAITLAYLAVNLVFSVNLGRMIAQAITVDLRNATLLEEVTRAKELAEQLNLARSRFLAAASHDLRQPLHAMGLFLDALRHRLPNAPEQHLLDSLQATHAALDGLFNALLEISRLDAGAVTPHRVHQAIGPLLDELAREISAEAGAKGLAVVVHATDEVIWSDPVLLRRILRNLLSNAVRYTQAGRIELGAARDGAMVRLHVRDTGIGIPSNELSRIFDEYHQVGNVERDRSQGLGLGLAVVRRMAALLDHPVEVESRVGSGSTFSIRVPPGERDHIVTAPSHDEEPGLQGVLVVMVDDEEAILRGMRLLLEDWGCQVLTAGSGAAALAAVAAESRRPDILITDYRLRAGETGVDVIRALRDRLGVDLPAVLVSGDTDPALLRSLNAQGLDLLHKPVKPAHLMKTMRDLLEARRRDRSA